MMGGSATEQANSIEAESETLPSCHRVKALGLRWAS